MMTKRKRAVFENADPFLKATVDEIIERHRRPDGTIDRKAAEVALEVFFELNRSNPVVNDFTIGVAMAEFEPLIEKEVARRAAKGEGK